MEDTGIIKLLVSHIEHTSRVPQSIDIIMGKGIGITVTYDNKLNTDSLLATVLGALLFIAW
jgi:Na+-transporting methylmalonyl-CoA/oxaloacetate decarboxylase beta subunit